MGPDAFYRHCREGGLDVTREETDFMRNSWIEAFKEMQYHLSEQQPMTAPVAAKRQLCLPGLNAVKLTLPEEPIGDGDEDLEEVEDKFADQNRKLYLARCFCGMTRANASLNAACNFTFQST